VVESSRLMPFVAKLERHVALSEADRDALLSLPCHEVNVDAGTCLPREGDRAASCTVVLSGFACTHKLLADGNRQILAIYMKGDAVDLHNALSVVADVSVLALTALEVAVIPAQALQELLDTRPQIARALWVETLVDASIQREWTINVGRRDSRTRVAHLLCELGLRQEAAGVAARAKYVLPLTQEQLADATAMTAVHVNRVLQALTREGVIDRDKRMLTMASWDSMADVGQFSPNYLQPVQKGASAQAS
jgi:CRP-like cAMP-binding protein